MPKLSDHINEIAAAVRKISRQNYLLCGISESGNLVMDEAVDSGNRFKPEDVVEQTSIRGGTPKAAIVERLAYRDCLAEEGAEDAAPKR